MSLLHRVNVGLFVLVLVAGGLLFLMTEHDDVSEGEKRVLAKMPEVSWQAITDRKFFRAIDDFVADNFAFRTALTELSGEIKAARGWLNDDVQIYANGARKSAPPVETIEHETAPAISAGPQTSGLPETFAQADSANETVGTNAVQLPEVTAAGPAQSVADSTPSVQVAETDKSPAEPLLDKDAQTHKDAREETDNTSAEPVVVTPPSDAKMIETKITETKPSDVKATEPKASETKINTTSDPYQVIEAVIVYRGRALQIMGGTPPMAVPMIQAVNRYQQELGPDVTVYFMAAPIGSDFYLPEKVTRGVMREKILIDSIHGRLNPAVRAVPAYDHLAGHTDDYLYFNTDHHWTGRGAYYAYTAFAKVAGFSPLPLSNLSMNVINNFLGTLYYRTMSPALKAKGDTVEYFKIPNRTDVTVFNAGMRAGYTGQLYAESAKGGNAYGVFLGGDAPLMRIRSDVNNNRKIVVIKDSYGNAFVPYLAAHYQEVYVIDYRSYKGNIKSLIRDQGIQDVLFAHNTFVVASGYAAQQAVMFLSNPNQ